MPAQWGGGGTDPELGLTPVLQGLCEGYVWPGRTPPPRYSRRQVCIQSVCLGPLPVSALWTNVWGTLLGVGLGDLSGHVAQPV